MKTFDKKDVYSWSNAEKAKEYVGKLGYFGDSLEDIKKWVQKYPPDFLFQILGKDEKKRFMVDDPEVYIFKLFLPAIKVIEAGEPKKWRAYKNVNEFDYAVGDTIHLRLKHKPSSEYIYLITGFNLKENSISINGVTGNFENFFDLYEIFNGKDWHPFGVLEDD